MKEWTVLGNQTCKLPNVRLNAQPSVPAQSASFVFVLHYCFQTNPQNGYYTHSCIFCIVVVTKQEMTTLKPTPTPSTVSPKDNGTTKATMDTTPVTETTQVTTLPNCPAGHAESGGCGGTFVGGMVLGMCIPIALYIVFFCWRRRQSRVKFRNSLSVRADE